MYRILSIRMTTKVCREVSASTTRAFRSTSPAYETRASNKTKIRLVYIIRVYNLTKTRLVFETKAYSSTKIKSAIGIRVSNWIRISLVFIIKAFNSTKIR